MNLKSILKNIGKVFVVILTAVVLFYIFIIASLTLAFNNVNGDIYSYVLLAMAIFIEMIIIGALWGFIRKNCFMLRSLFVWLFAL